MVNWEIYLGSSAEWDASASSLGAGFYQSYGWSEVRRVAGWKPLRLMARSPLGVVAVANVLVKRKMNAAICWIPDGPAGCLEYFDNAFKETLSRLLETHFLYCRIGLLRSNTEDEARFLQKNGWNRPKSNMSSGLTMLYSLLGDEDERLKKTTGNWRHNLKRSNRHGLCVEQWMAPDPAALSELYREMEALKSIPIQHSEQELEAIFTHLREQIIVYRCTGSDGKLLAIRAAGIFGDTAMDLLAAAGAEARKVYASHATLWALLNHCHGLGLSKYDLSGVDPIGNKGVFDFKHGTGASMIECLGEWEWASMPGMCFAVNCWIARNV